MNRTIDEQLTTLKSIKSDIKSAINDAYGSPVLVSDDFASFATFISEKLTKRTEPVTRFTVTFNANGGDVSAPSAQTVNSGTSITLPSYRGNKSGYVRIDGWATESSAVTPRFYFGDLYTVSTNITLYAVFVESATLYTLSFDANGGEGEVPMNIERAAGETFTLPECSFEKEGYTFVGWSTSSSATTAMYENGGSYTMTDSNVVLYAVYASNGYTVSWERVFDFGGEITATVGGVVIVNGVTYVVPGKTVSMMYVPPTGCRTETITWTGNPLVEGSTTTSVSFVMPDSNVNEITVTNVNNILQYTLVAKSNDDRWGTVSGSGTYDENTVAIISAVAKDGYEFISWNDGDMSATREIVMTSDLVYTAVFAEVGTGVKVKCVQFVNIGDKEMTLEDFVEYSSENVKVWFDVDGLMLKEKVDDNYVDFGALTTVVFNDSGSGANATGSKCMYWLAVPTTNSLTSFETNGDDIISHFGDNSYEKCKLFANVTLGDVNPTTYNLYGLWTETQTENVVLHFS